VELLSFLSSSTIKEMEEGAGGAPFYINLHGGDLLMLQLHGAL
jgi:hypothetical protein